MDTTTLVVTSATLAMGLIELIKLVVRKVQVWKYGTVKELPMKFYYFLLPVLTFAVQPVMAFFGWADYAIPTDWTGWVFELVRVGVTSALSVVLYENSIAPLKRAKESRQG